MDDTIKQLIERNELDTAMHHALALPDTEAQTWLVRGRIHSRRGNMSEALSCYSRALHIDPACGEARALIEMASAIFDFRDPSLLNP
ncbi:MAG: hypothetical protein IJU72_05685 [Bacteroidales bacterium]|nr:hypothetical protein [Bacteroidales bacterium]